tara:strand:+ start:113 stop:304 length:192 start_codon:yes stop_codon:yes gene_type:complete
LLDHFPAGNRDRVPLKNLVAEGICFGKDVPGEYPPMRGYGIIDLADELQGGSHAIRLLITICV